MSVVKDPLRDVYTSVTSCRSCGRKIYWSLTERGRRCPYDVGEQGEATRISHFATCPQAREWSHRGGRWGQ